MTCWGYQDDEGWEDEMERAEMRKPRPFRCSDGYCGATDCARCYPGIDHNRRDDDEIVDLLN